MPRVYEIQPARHLPKRHYAPCQACRTCQACRSMRVLAGTGVVTSKGADRYAAEHWTTDPLAAIVETDAGHLTFREHELLVSPPLD